jgi:hypothetical protein
MSSSSKLIAKILHAEFALSARKAADPHGRPEWTRTASRARDVCQKQAARATIGFAAFRGFPGPINALQFYLVNI